MERALSLCCILLGITPDPVYCICIGAIQEQQLAEPNVWSLPFTMLQTKLLKIWYCLKKKTANSILIILLLSFYLISSGA